MRFLRTSTSQSAAANRPRSAESSGGIQPLGSLVGQLMARRGYAQVIANEHLQSALEAEVGAAVASVVRVGNLKAGVLHVYAADSVTMQELTFRKRQLIKRLQAAQPTPPIKDVRFHVSAALGD